MIRKIFFYIVLFYSIPKTVNSQDIFRLNTDTITSYDLLFQEDEDTLMIDKKEKKKKNVFFGIKTKKGFIRTTSGRNLVYENFHYIKTPEIKNEYAQEIYFYDKKKKKIVRSKKIVEGAVMMHGPYKKRLGEQIIEEGIFYYGLKHDRWVRFNRSDILQDKEFFSLGWYNESIRFFWDTEKKKIKEIIQVRFGEKQGKYFAFFENGDIAATGQFSFDKPVGTWTEFYKSGKKKREIKHNESAFNLNESFITREWNINGKLIYDRNLFIRE
tara:strand:- start:1291 stop:2100 length:810 start_codon:yes stop_codon:yes gene_type:complete